MRENFTPFEQKIMKELTISANKKIMPYDFIAKHMDAIAIELDEDDKFWIIINGEFPADRFEYSNGEKSILDIMHIISYLENQELILIEYFTKNELKVKGDKIRIFNKEKYNYYEKLDNDEDAALEDAFFKALRAGHYPLKGSENGQQVEYFNLESKLKAGVYVYDFMKKHYGCFLYVSPALAELVDKNFKTHDQIRFEGQMSDALQKHKESMHESKKQTKYAIGAFIVALLAFLVSLVSAIITQYSNDNKLLRNEIRSVKLETPRLVNQQINRDTINVNIIKK